MSLPVDTHPTVTRFGVEGAVKCALFAEVLDRAASARLRVTGRSMLPSVWPGDTLIVRRIGAEELARGDILLFRRNGGLVAHRVVSAGADELGRVTAKGDSLPTEDAPVLREDVLGVVVRIVRRGIGLEPRSRLAPHERIMANLFQRIPSMGRAAICMRSLGIDVFANGKSA